LARSHRKTNASDISLIMKKLYQAVLADLDGTVNRGELLIDGAQGTYSRLSAKGVRWLFLSNNAQKMAGDLAKKLSDLGLTVASEQVINSASALIDSLEKDHAGARVMVLGEPGLVHGIQAAGSVIEKDPLKTDIVVVGMDRGLTYEKIKLAYLAISHGALFWATNLDPLFPVPGGFHPGAGAVVASVIAAAGPPGRVFGKPETDMANLALDRLKLPRESCLVVGDRMDTDILFAKKARMDSALVLTGATSRGNLPEYDYSPDYVFDTIADIETLFD
jgi:HAD superfamily hydrolase (TIGR01450 family)